MTKFDISNKNIIVTGGAGFIGSRLVGTLVELGASVSIIDDLSTGKKENLHPRARFYHLDMGDEKVSDVFKKEQPDIVYHLAFNTNVPQSVVNPLFDARGISGSLNIFLNAHRSKVKKVVMASSSFVYGNTHSFPLTEQHPTQPISPYAISKIASENYLRFFNQAYNLPFVVLRYATVYGPRQIGGALADYIRKISSHQHAEMYGDGNLTRDYVYVDDVVRANLLVLELDDHHPEPIFNLGSGQEITLNVLYEKIARLLGQPDNHPLYLPQRAGEMLRFVVSHEKAKKEFGWEPQISLDEGILRTLKAYKLIS
ncbi:MAG: NAD-dependent epimerase/dehydratase family protein [Candidatus Liptonbacteria bacterium]|nr:NAD-dependent epimerase/dehydratase family protein [Candidatus Liptonbacteria bacterium]